MKLVDEQVKESHHNKTIGIIIFKEKLKISSTKEKNIV